MRLRTEGCILFVDESCDHTFSLYRFSLKFVLNLTTVSNVSNLFFNLNVQCIHLFYDLTKIRNHLLRGALCKEFNGHRNRSSFCSSSTNILNVCISD